MKIKKSNCWMAALLLTLGFSLSSANAIENTNITDALLDQPIHEALAGPGRRHADTLNTAFAIDHHSYAGSQSASPSIASRWVRSNRIGVTDT